jgi:hypothetical protein
MSLGRTKTPFTSSRITVGTSPTAVAIHGRLLAIRSKMQCMFRNSRFKEGLATLFLA